MMHQQVQQGNGSGGEREQNFITEKLDKLEHQVAIFLEKAGVDLSKKGTKKSSLQIAPVEENLFD